LEFKEPKDRDKYETLLIHTVAECTECKASDNWLGKYSPDTASGKKIKGSGLWNVSKINKGGILNKEQLDTIEEHLIKK
jgi:hypothetical protein